MVKARTSIFNLLHRSMSWPKGTPHEIPKHIPNTVTSPILDDSIIEQKTPKSHNDMNKPDKGTLVQQILDEIATSEEHQKFLAQFDNRGAVMLKYFANYKADFILEGDQSVQINNKYLDEYLSICWSSLEQIQNKKLFDLQCQWRAGHIKSLPDINTTEDFKAVKEKILDYRGIPPVSEEEVGIYIDYLHCYDISANAEWNYRKWYTTYFQDHQIVKDIILGKEVDEHNKADYSYFQYCYNRFGGYDLLALPDVKKDKEEYYMQLVAKKNKRKQAHGNGNNDGAATARKVNEPFKINYRCGTSYLKEMALLVGNKKLAEHIDCKVRRHDNGLFTSLSFAIDYLKDLPQEDIQLDEDKEWKSTILEAVEKHKIKNAIGLLPTVYEEYKMKWEQNIRITAEKKYPYSIHHMYNNFVLEGRELNGEPRDFNY